MTPTASPTPEPESMELEQTVEKIESRLRECELDRAGTRADVRGLREALNRLKDDTEKRIDQIVGGMETFRASLDSMKRYVWMALGGIAAIAFAAPFIAQAVIKTPG